jgi:HlyD family secretion protein
VPQPPEAPLAKGQGRVFLITNDKPGDEKDEQKLISIGVTDGIFTEVMPNALPQAAKVVTDENESEEDKKKKKKGP